jgi:hypothetical protein
MSFLCTSNARYDNHGLLPGQLYIHSTAIHSVSRLFHVRDILHRAFMHCSPIHAGFTILNMKLCSNREQKLLLSHVSVSGSLELPDGQSLHTAPTPPADAWFAGHAKHGKPP